MSEAIKPTPGPWHVANGVQIRGEREQIAKVWMMRSGEGKANARLIAEAGTVHHETGLTPRQLVERVWRLEEHLKLIANMPPTLARDDPQLAVRIAQDALSKALPNTVAEVKE